MGEFSLPIYVAWNTMEHLRYFLGNFQEILKTIS